MILLDKERLLSEQETLKQQLLDYAQYYEGQAKLAEIGSAKRAHASATFANASIHPRRRSEPSKSSARE
jgi:hypothetical protein